MKRYYIGNDTPVWVLKGRRTFKTFENYKKALEYYRTLSLKEMLTCTIEYVEPKN